MRNSARTEEIYQLIVDWPRRHGHPPVYRELAEAAGVTVSTTYWHVGRLMGEGRVISDAGKTRTLRAR